MALRGRIGAHELHAQYDTNVVSAPGRRAAETALNAKLLAEIDPQGLLSDVERERRLNHARSAHFARIALRRVKKARQQPTEAGVT